MKYLFILRHRKRYPGYCNHLVM